MKILKVSPPDAIGRFCGACGFLSVSFSSPIFDHHQIDYLYILQWIPTYFFLYSFTNAFIAGKLGSCKNASMAPPPLDKKSNFNFSELLFL